MAYISKIRIPNPSTGQAGNIYEIKDAWAREAIAALEGGSYFLGVSSTEIYDNPEEDPDTDPRIKVNGSNEWTVATNGNMAIYEQGEFVWSSIPRFYISHEEDAGYWYERFSNPTQEQINNAIVISLLNVEDDPDDYDGTDDERVRLDPFDDERDGDVCLFTKGKWTEFGDLSSLGALAYKNTVSAALSFNSAVNAVTGVSVGAPIINLSLSDNTPTGGGTYATVSTPTGSASLDSGSVTFSGNGADVVGITTGSVTVTSVPNVTAADTWNFAMGTTAGNEETLIITGEHAKFGNPIKCVSDAGGGTALTVSTKTARLASETASVGTSITVSTANKYITGSSGTPSVTPSTEPVVPSTATVNVTVS